MALNLIGFLSYDPRIFLRAMICGFSAGASSNPGIMFQRALRKQKDRNQRCEI